MVDTSDGLDFVKLPNNFDTIMRKVDEEDEREVEARRLRVLMREKWSKSSPGKRFKYNKKNNINHKWKLPSKRMG